VCNVQQTWTVARKPISRTLWIRDVYNVVRLLSADVDLTILIAGLERSTDPATFVDTVRRATDGLPATREIVAAVEDPRLEAALQSSDLRVVISRQPGFGAALRAGLRAARGTWTITLDPDVSGPLTFVQDLWAHRHDAEIVVASRYIDGSRHAMPPVRATASAALNAVFRRGLSFGIRDGSSALRLYRTDVVNGLALEATDYDVLQEVLVRAYAAGWCVREIPLEYSPSPSVPSKALMPLGRAYVRTFWRLWKLRNSIAAADYDYRAHDSPIPLQRFWQRSRHRYITELIAGQGAVLDVGCGSSHIIEALPRGSVALDVLINKLRFARRFNVPRVRASGFALPFADESFACVLCSQVIEHVPMEPSMIDELCRVLKPGGRLVLGTPDYDRWEWVYIEKAYGFFAPGGYADEHISHYTREGLLADFVRRGYAHEATRYILRGELILAFRKPVGPHGAQ
jgi:SAM-dependent methyltransferase